MPNTNKYYTHVICCVRLQTYVCILWHFLVLNWTIKKISMERLNMCCILMKYVLWYVLFLGMCTHELSVTLLWIGYTFTSACCFPIFGETVVSLVWILKLWHKFIRYFVIGLVVFRKHDIFLGKVCEIIIQNCLALWSGFLLGNHNWPRNFLSFVEPRGVCDHCAQEPAVWLQSNPVIALHYIGPPLLSADESLWTEVTYFLNVGEACTSHHSQKILVKHMFS